MAVIGGVAGLVTGAAGSLTAPWAQWGIEQRRLRHQSRAELITEWRAGIDALRTAEDEAVPHISFPAIGEHSGGYLAMDDGRPDPPEARDTAQNWYERLSPYLSAEAHKSLKQLRGKRIIERQGKMPDLLRAEVARIERDWKLV